MKLGIIARADLTGLGIQSRNWVRLLNPSRTIVINSTPFNGNQQHLEWYDDRGGYIVNGFIQQNEINPILNGLDAILTFEIPYNYDLFNVARARGVKTILQNNWEFTDYLRNPDLPLPDLMMNHSYWHFDEQFQRWPDISAYCATPVFIEDYDEIMLQNMDRYEGKRRFLHVAGRKTYEDRNGTQQLLAALKIIPAGYDFEFVIKSQNAEVGLTSDPRIIVDESSPTDEKELYRDFDAVFMPRRYGGACLPMTEALASGLPVIMPSVSPNNMVLPPEWLVPAKYAGSFMTRTEIDIYDAEVNALADKIIEFITCPIDNLVAHKIRAREIACNEYSSEAVKEKWTGLITEIGL